MRSLIILEVEHGETTDDLEGAVECIARYLPYDTEGNVSVNNWSVRVDLPACFVLDTGESPCWVGGDCVRTPGGIIHSGECYALIMEDAPKDDVILCILCRHYGQGHNGDHLFPQRLTKE